MHAFVATRKVRAKFEEPSPQYAEEPVRALESADYGTTKASFCGPGPLCEARARPVLVRSMLTLPRASVRMCRLGWGMLEKIGRGR